MSRISWAGPSDRAHVLTWLSWAVLLGVQVVDAWMHHLPWIFWLARLLPLLIFLPGMLRENLRSYIWLCFVSLLYFIALVERLVAQADSVLSIVGMFAVVTLFTAAMMFVRWRARELKASASGEVGVS